MSNSHEHPEKKPELPRPPGPGLELEQTSTPEVAPLMDSVEDAGARALSEALSSSFKIVKVLMVALVLIFIASGVFTVNPNQLAIVLRFGKPMGTGSEQLLKPGLHWSFPYPVDEIVLIPVGQSHTVRSTGAWFAISPEQEAAGQTPPPARSMQPGVDGYTLTSDGNIIHARATLKYRLRPEAVVDYLFKFGDPTNLLQNVLNNSLLYASTRYTADDVIFRDKIGYRDLVSKRLNQVLDDIQLNITIDSLEVETSAPLDVRPAFDEAYNAQLTAVTKISEAEAYSRSATNGAIGQSSVVISDSITYSNQLVKTVAAEAASFTQQLPYFKQNPQLFKQRLLAATMQKVLTNAQDKFFIPNRADGKSRQLRLQLSREPQKPVAKEPGQP